MVLPFWARKMALLAEAYLLFPLPPVIFAHKGAVPLRIKRDALFL